MWIPTISTCFIGPRNAPREETYSCTAQVWEEIRRQWRFAGGNGRVHGAGPATGTRSTTGASSATCARAPASSATASGACASCGPARTTRSCSPPTAARAASASTRSRRSRSTTSCPARRSSRSAPRGCNLACRFCQNWDISKSKEIDTLADAASPETIARAAAELGCRSVAFTYNDPIDLPRVRDRRGRRLPRPRDRRRSPSPPATSAPSRGPSSSAISTPPTSTSRGSPRTSTATSAAASSAPCSTRSSTCARDRRVVRDHHPADPRPQRQRRRARRDDHAGSSSTSGPTCRCTSPRSIPTTGCSTGRPRRRRRSPGPGASRSANGVRYAYTGNVHDRDGQSTSCPGCGARVIDRDWYQLGDVPARRHGQLPGLRDRLAGRLRSPGRRPGSCPPARRAGPGPGPAKNSSFHLIPCCCP